MGKSTEAVGAMTNTAVPFSLRTELCQGKVKFGRSMRESLMDMKKPTVRRRSHLFLCKPA